MSRDLAWEASFYKDLDERVARQSALDPSSLIALTQTRMAGIGASQYGDDAFLTDGRDLIKELSDEAADTVAYVVMELQKIHHSGEEYPDAVNHLYEAAVHACIADAHARAARLARRTGDSG